MARVRRRQARGLHHGPRHDRAEADELLTEKQNDLYKGRSGADDRVSRITSPTWADAWQEILEERAGDPRRRPAPTYLHSDRLRPPDVRPRRPAHDRQRRYSAASSGPPRREDRATRRSAKHLRHLSACLKDAFVDGYIDMNPMSRFDAGLDVPPSEANYFTNAELQRLWQQLRVGLPDKNDRVRPISPVYLYLCRFAVTTGCRRGELLALGWDDVRLQEGEHGELRITKSVNERGHIGPPKTRSSRRPIHMTADARRVLEEWAHTFWPRRRRRRPRRRRARCSPTRIGKPRPPDRGRHRHARPGT